MKTGVKAFIPKEKWDQGSMGREGIWILCPNRHTHIILSYGDIVLKLISRRHQRGKNKMQKVNMREQ